MADNDVVNLAFTGLVCNGVTLFHQDQEDLLPMMLHDVSWCYMILMVLHCSITRTKKISCPSWWSQRKTGTRREKPRTRFGHKSDETWSTNEQKIFIVKHFELNRKSLPPSKRWRPVYEKALRRSEEQRSNLYLSDGWNKFMNWKEPSLINPSLEINSSNERCCTLACVCTEAVVEQVLSN